MTIYLGIALALVCAFVTNLGFLLKHRGVSVAPDISARAPWTSVKCLARSKLFLVGMGVAAVAWLFHVGALAMAPMTTVQAVLAGGVVLLAVTAERLFGVRLRRKQWVGVLLTAAGLALLSVVMPPLHKDSSYSLAGMIAVEAGLLALALVLVVGHRLGTWLKLHHHGPVLGVAAGVLFGVSDTAVKALSGQIAHAGLIGGLLSPWSLVAAIASVLGFYASIRGLQKGEAVPVIALMGTAANVTGMLSGILVFGDPLPGSTTGMVIQMLALAMVCLAGLLVPAPVRAAKEEHLRAGPGGAMAAAV